MNCPTINIQDEQYSDKAKVVIGGTVGFSVENKGNTKVWIGFGEEEGRVIDILPSDSRTFQGLSGLQFRGNLNIRFDSSIVPAGVPPKNLCLVIKYIFVAPTV